MQPKSKIQNQAGFSLLETLIVLGVMIILTGGVFSLMSGSMKVATATFELTDAQESLRTAQEFISRDLVNAGDGLTSVNPIFVRRAFQTDYLTLNPIEDTRLGIITSDNSVPAGTVITGTDPAMTIRSDQGLTDRQTILQIDETFSPNITPISIAADGSTINVSTANAARLAIGEIIFLTSSRGGAFATITNITGNDPNFRVLNFANADTYKLNLVGAGGNIQYISNGGTLPTSLMRMKIIHYYVNSDGLLMRRVFGVRNAGFRESVIAEHVLNVQFLYSLSITDANGNVVQPTATLSTTEQRTAVRQVEVTVTVETPHPLAGGTKQLSSVNTTSVRNMQFRTARQPTAGG